VVVDVAVDSMHTKGPQSWRYLAGAGLTASTKPHHQYMLILAAGAVRLLLDDKAIDQRAVGVHVWTQIVTLNKPQQVHSVQ